MTWEVLCKCSGKYIDIYFNLKITFYANELNWVSSCSQRLECLPTTIKERRKISLLPDIYSDTLDTDFSVDVPVRRMALLSTLTFDVPVRPMDAKGLIS